MQRRDYVIDVILESGRAWAALVERIKTRPPEAALIEIDRASLALLGLRLERTRSLSTAALLARLTYDEPARLGHEKCLLVAALMYAAARHYAAMGRTADQQAYLVRALEMRLLCIRRDSEAELPPFAPDVTTLLGELGDTPLPPEVAALLQHDRQG